MLTKKQYSAMDRSKKLSKILVEEIPQIADDYKNNLTLREIIHKYGIIERYNIVNEEIIRAGVSRALKLLLSEQELKELAKIHNKSNGIDILKNRNIAFWTNEERYLLLKLIKENDDRGLITDLINNTFYNGKLVRTRKSVNSIIYRLKTKENSKKQKNYISTLFH